MDKTILIVDDDEISRSIPAEIFKDDYHIIEACDGNQAINIINEEMNIAAVLLDLFMPGINGLEVLKEMNRSGKIEFIPVFLITAANTEKMLLEGYYLGAVDVIGKPFIAQFLKQRIQHTIDLYSQRNELEHIVEEQVKRLNHVNQSMIETLAELIEFRDCESGEHVKRICGLTKILMSKVSDMYSEYYLPKQKIDNVVQASILHDVGKISIPDHILNKPGRLTSEEFEIMKQHTTKGCELLQKISDVMRGEIYSYSYSICRSHHERWDGNGYPDGLKGDEIPIWAQVVAVADVYDALTAERVYKNAFSHEKAVKMIFEGECGAFNPKVLKAFEESLDKIKGKEWIQIKK